MRAEDTAGRMSGDEFVVVIEGLDGSAGLDTARRRVESALARPFGGGVVVGVSVGAALWSGESVEELLHLADARMYERKRARRSAAPVLLAGWDQRVTLDR